MGLSLLTTSLVFTYIVPDHYCCLAPITLLWLRNKYLRTNLRRRYADLFHQVGKIISLSPSLANTDGFITEFHMICYRTSGRNIIFGPGHFVGV